LFGVRFSILLSARSSFEDHNNRSSKYIMTKRETVLVVGSTGSLGRPIVVELLRRQYKLRLLVRSHESVLKAGYVKWAANDLEIVVCKDMTDRSQYQDEWFADVICAICVARPRSLKEGGRKNFGPMIESLCDAVIQNEVPRLLIHGMPYMETNPFDLESPTMKIRKDAEISARKHFNASVFSSLSITKIAEMSEIAHIKQSVELLGFIPLCWGHNPLLQPISSDDFGIFIGDYVDDKTMKNELLLVGGPQQMTWRELGQKIQASSEQRLPFITLPLLFYRIILLILGLCSSLIPSLRGLYISLLLTSVPMTTNIANKDFIFVGEDTVESFLQIYSTDRWVHKRVFGERSSLPSIKSLAQVLVALFTACDGLVALFKPSVVSVLQNINVSDPTVDRFILIVFGIAACSISAVTFVSIAKGQETRATGTGIAIQIALSVWYFCIGNEARAVGICMPVIYTYIIFCTLVLVRLMFHDMYPSTIMAVSTIVISLVHYLQPSIVQYSLDIDPVNLGDKTLQHIRQAFMYHIANGVQMLALACGVKPEKAVGMICLTWFICSMDFWFFKQVDEVFEMSRTSRNINLTFPLWTGSLALILLYPSR